MRTDTFTTEPVIDLLHQQTVASLPQISAALGSPSHRTVCRKLVQAGCRSSYSHCGRYYTLDELASYDEHGLWNCDGIRFSSKGSLMSTAQHLTETSEGGHTASELSEIVGVDAYPVLYKLTRAGRLSRADVDGTHILYCSADQSQRNKQLRARQIMCAGGLPELPHEAHQDDSANAQAVATLFNLLDERQKRLFAGLESLRLGRGGDHRIAERLGLSPTTVATGRKQLLAGGLDPSRIRRAGGGRKTVEKKLCPHRDDR